MTHTTPDPDSAEQERSSLGALFNDLTQNVSLLVRQEIELAKTELKESASSAGKGAGMYAGAGVAGHFVLLFLSVAAFFGLALWIGYGFSALVIAALWAVIGLVLASAAKKKMQEIKGLPNTAETVKRIPSAFTPKDDAP
ncbi:phage holin family protein [Glutamicibacter mishrai]|uniref:phage holin family protein n=1 Tax=Glutamicibacter mishrai TaxID=1775880 RepID=UPI003F7A76CF